MDLEIGTISEIEEEPQKVITSRRSGSGGGSNGRGRHGGGGGDDRSDSDQNDQTEEFKPDKYRVGMGLILLVVLMTFGALIGAYVVLATNHPLEWKPFNLPFQIWISTGLIIVSSIDYELARKNLLSGNQAKARKWFSITAILGTVFIASQIMAWFNLVSRGYYASGNPYAGLFYILTGVHVVHVAGGIVSLAFIFLKTQNETNDDDELLKRQWLATVVGWYWHFIGVLWIVLFLLLGLYK